MALAHGRLKVISRSNRNTVRALAYRTGCKVYDHRTGQLMITRKKMHDVQHVESWLVRDQCSDGSNSELVDRRSFDEKTHFQI